MADIAITAPANADPLPKHRDKDALDRFYRDLEAFLATGAADCDAAYKARAAEMVKLRKAYSAAPKRNFAEEDAANVVLDKLTEEEELWLSQSTSDLALLELQLQFLTADAQSGSCVEPWHLDAVRRGLKQAKKELASGPASETFLDPMAPWRPTPENVAQLPSCVRKRAKRNKRASADVAHVLARRDWLWRWQAAARDLELLEKAAARTEEEHLQATRAGDHTSAEILGTMWDALHRAQEALLQIPAPDLAGLERKVAILKRREEEEAPVSIGVIISILASDGIRLARPA